VIYRAIVRRQVRTLFSEANNGNWASIVDGLASTFSYRFIGDTPLGGTRTTHEAMRHWFERLYRLMTYVKIRGTIPTNAGQTAPYENEFMQSMILRWGKITSVLTLEDTQRFVDALPRLAASGITDATATPITDNPT
jgi:hypothetical protein